MDEKRKAVGAHQTTNLNNKLYYTNLNLKKKRKLPPFGKRLLRRTKGQSVAENDVFIFIVLAFILDTIPRQTVRLLAYTLLKTGATVVRVVFRASQQLVIYSQGVAI